MSNINRSKNLVAKNLKLNYHGISTTVIRRCPKTKQWNLSATLDISALILRRLQCDNDIVCIVHDTPHAFIIAFKMSDVA